MDSATTDTAIVPPLKTQDENPSGDTGDNCPVCIDAIGTRGMVRTACGHAFCFGCFESFIVRSNSCPMCRTKVMGEDSALDKCIRPLPDGGQKLFTEAAARDLASDVALILLASGNEDAPHLMRSFNLDTTSDRSTINQVARRVVDGYNAREARLADDIIYTADWFLGGGEEDAQRRAEREERREREATQRAIREREAAERQAAETARRERETTRHEAWMAAHEARMAQIDDGGIAETARREREATQRAIREREAAERQAAETARREREAAERQAAETERQAAETARQAAEAERQAAETERQAAEKRARDERFRNDPGSGRAWCARCSMAILINRDGKLRRHSPCGSGMAPYQS